MTPIGRFVRARLRRRIFTWFIGGLMTSGLTVAIAMTLLVRLDSQPPQWQAGRLWIGKQFARSWDDPVALEAYAREMSNDFGAAIELHTYGSGRVLAVGGSCHHHSLDFPVVRNGVEVGMGRMCFNHGSPGPGANWWLVACMTLGAMWFASGRIARRLASPLDELAQVVRKIGTGDLKARAQLGCAEPDEIGLVSEAVNDMAARIEKQMADQRELLATVSHEMRTPLARVRIISEIARETGATQKTFDDLDREVVEMDSLVGDLLASSRVEFGQLSKRALSVRDLCKEASERAGLSPAQWRVQGEDSIVADPTLLHRALANLFDNARKHASGVSSFEVTVTPQRTRFEVTDCGTGFQGEAEALFRKFTRGERAADGGLGLGLALVKRIAEAHHGDVFAHNREQGGAVFGFDIETAATT